MLATASAALDSAAVTFRFILAFVLAAAAIPKLVAPREFELAVRNYALLPSRLVAPVAAWLPRLEVACAFALMFGALLRAVAFAACALLIGFSVAVGVNLARGRQIECGCQGSVAPRRIGWDLVATDLVLAGMAATLAFGAPRVLALDSLGVNTDSSLAESDGLALLLIAGVAVLAHQLVSSLVKLRSATESAEIFRGGSNERKQ